MPGMGVQPMVLGPNGPVPAGMVLPPYGAPPAFPAGAGLPPRFGGGPQSPVGVRPGRMHRTGDDLDKVSIGAAARLAVPLAWRHWALHGRKGVEELTGAPLCLRLCMAAS